MRLLTVQQLRDLDACEEQIEAFEQKWGPSLEVTEGVFDDVAQLFDWDWGSYNLLSDAGSDEYNREHREESSKWREPLEELREKARQTDSKEDWDNLYARRIERNVALNLFDARLFARLYIAEGNAPPKPPEEAGTEVTNESAED